MGLTPRDDAVLPEFLYHMLSSLDLVSHSRRAAKGRTLNKEVVSRIRIPVPPIPEQRSFVEEMDHLEAAAGQKREEARDLDRDRRDLAHLFMSDQAGR